MAKKLQLVNGIPKMMDESASPTIYDQTLKVVASSPGAGEILGPISANTSVTLPSSGTYDSAELIIELRGQVLINGQDFTYVSSPPRTQVQFPFQLEIGDIVRFKKHRGI